MRWGRAIVAVLVGVLTSALAAATLGELHVFYWVQEFATWITPQAVSDSGFYLIDAAFDGLVIALPGIIVAVLIAATGRHPAPNRCRACGYDLTGNVSGKCPECGEASSLGD